MLFINHQDLIHKATSLSMPRFVTKCFIALLHIYCFIAHLLSCFMYSLVLTSKKKNKKKSNKQELYSSRSVPDKNLKCALVCCDSFLFWKAMPGVWNRAQEDQMWHLHRRSRGRRIKKQTKNYWEYLFKNVTLSIDCSHRLINSKQ